jgi:hypothetical protein
MPETLGDFLFSFSALFPVSVESFGIWDIGIWILFVICNLVLGTCVNCALT